MSTMSSVQEAATTIIALINAKPQSPRAEEIEAILHRIGGAAHDSLPPMSPPHAEHYAEWRRLIEDHLRQFGEGCEAGLTDAEVEAMEVRMGEHTEVIDALAHRILDTPARTWGDVALIAEVAFWAQWPGHDPEGPEARAQMEGGLHSTEGICDLSTIKLIEAVFTVAGIGPFAKTLLRAAIIAGLKDDIIRAEPDIVSAEKSCARRGWRSQRSPIAPSTAC